MACTNFPKTGLVVDVTEHTVGDTTYVWDGIGWKPAKDNLTGEDIVLESGQSVQYYVDNLDATEVSSTNGNVQGDIDSLGDLVGQSSEAIKAILVAQGLSGSYGFFADGFSYVNEGDVGISTDNKIYKYVGVGAPAKEVAAGTNPSGDGDYEVVVFNDASNISMSSGESVQKFTTQSRQAIEAAYKAQGYNNVFFFEDGFTYTESNDVGIYEDGTAWTYADAGALPVAIDAGTVPSEGVYNRVKISNYTADSVDDLKKLIIAPNFIGSEISTRKYFAIEGVNTGAGTWYVTTGEIANNIDIVQSSVHDNIQFLLKVSSFMMSESFGLNRTSVDNATILNRAIERVNGLGGGVVYLSTDVEANNLVNILDNVTLKSANNAEISSTHNGKSHWSIVYLKENSILEGVRIRGSRYLSQSNSTEYTSYNKIGVSTQGAAIGNNAKVVGVGFSGLTNSCVYVHNGHRNTEITKCYTYGDMLGVYADIDGVTGEILSYNSTKDDVKLANGEQVYNLLNFYNSGVNTFSVTIRDNVGVDDITDSFAAVNDGAYDHLICGNVSRKTGIGYYGGYGLDFNAGNESVGSGNIFIGYRVGCHFYRGAKGNIASSNIYKTPVGTLYEAGGGDNISKDNEVILSKFGDFGVSAGVMVYESTRCRSSDYVQSRQTPPTQFSGNVSGFSSISRLGVNLVKVSLTNLPTSSFGRTSLIELINCGTLTGLWSVRELLDDGVILSGSLHNASHGSQNIGTWRSSTSGVAVCRNMSSSPSSIDANLNVYDVYTGAWCDEFTGSVLTTRGSDVISNVPAPRRGSRCFTGTMLNVGGISATGTRSANFGGTIGVSSIGSTKTNVTFPARDEFNSSYQVLATGEGCTVESITDKTVNGFSINHSAGSAGDKLNWIIYRT